MKIVTVEEMRAIEQGAVARGVSLDQLQLNAAEAIAGHLEGHAGPHIFLIGSGNNGRDALIAAAIHAEGGGTASAYLMPGAASDDVVGRLLAAGGKLLRDDGSASLDQLSRWIGGAHCVVDGLLGIGSRGPAREPMATVIDRVNGTSESRGCQVVAVDLPSGIDADTGEVPGPAIRATETLSLGCVKAGLLNPPASGMVGRLVPLEIGLPSEVYSHIMREYQSGPDVARLLPRRPLDAHKGSFGRVLVVAGSRRFVGAPYLCGAAAGRVGSGVVTLAVPEWQRTALAALFPEATYLPLPEVGDYRSAADAATEILDALPGCDVLAIGPGLGRGEAQTRLVVAVLEAAAQQAGLGVVVDADALNALSDVPDWWTRVGKDWVLTPHPGELARLTGLNASAVNRARTGTATGAAARWGEVLVLKGAYTVIASPDGRSWANGAAIPALATGGTGDVLTGTIAGLMAQGVPAIDAARAGVYVHAEAARRVLEDEGVPEGLGRLLASDLLPRLPRVLADSAGRR